MAETTNYTGVKVLLYPSNNFIQVWDYNDLWFGESQPGTYNVPSVGDLVFRRDNNTFFKVTALSSNISNPPHVPTLEQIGLLGSGGSARLLEDRGLYNASTNLFPSGTPSGSNLGGSGVNNAIMVGDIWTVTIGGVINGKTVLAGSTIRALEDTPGQNPSKWHIDYKIDSSSDNVFGPYVSLNALQVAHPTANSGDLAEVDSGETDSSTLYIYDAQSGWVETNIDTIPKLTTKNVLEHPIRKYFTQWRVLNTPIGTLLNLNSAILGTDTIKVVLNKLIRKITTLSNGDFLGTYVSLSALQTVYPTTTPGNQADVDSGGGSPATLYIYDAQDGWVTANATTGVTLSYLTTALANYVKSTTLATTLASYATKDYAESLVVGLVEDRGNWNASSNTFPNTNGSGTAGAILKGDLYFISVGGTLGGVDVGIGTSVRALTDNPGQTAGNWSIISTSLGFTPENIANKTSNITDFLSSTTKYWNILGVVNYIKPLKDQLTALSNGDFLGTYISLVALQTAYPTTTPGNSADVDTGGGSPATLYIYDAQDGWIVPAGSSGVTLSYLTTALAGYVKSSTLATTLAGYMTSANSAIQTFISYKETFATPAISGGVLTLNCAIANNFVVNHNANITSIVFTNVPNGVIYSWTLQLNQDATGTHTTAFPASFNWLSNGTAPTLTTAANKLNLLVGYTTNGGSSHIVSLAGKTGA